ncbi:hypothetical protein [Pseudomaricurvus sp.]
MSYKGHHYQQHGDYSMQDYLEELLDNAFEEFEDDDWTEDYSDV